MSTIQDEQLLKALTALKNGDFRVRLPTDQEGTAKEIAEVFNAHMEQLNVLLREVERIMRELGVDGKFGGQALVNDLGGNWQGIITQVNYTAGSLTGQVRDFAHAIHNLANDKPAHIPTVPVYGEMADLKQEIINLVERYGTISEKA
jgi:HAMP domain-containing protein